MKKILIALTVLFLISCKTAVVDTTTANVIPPGIDPDSMTPIVADYTNSLTVPFVEKYTGGHSPYTNYLVVQTLEAPVRKQPDTSALKVGTLEFYSKVELLMVVKNLGNLWYKVKTPDGTVGYVSSNLVVERHFRFNEGLKRILKTEKFIQDAKDAGYQMAIADVYEPNPSNQNVSKEKDKYGTSYDQSIHSLSESGERIFIPDRTILAIEAQNTSNNLIRVRAETIPEALVTTRDKVISGQSLYDNPITKTIIIDTANQNMMLYEKINGTWTLISYVLSKTGIESKIGYETPKGVFIAAVSKYEMPYNDEIGGKEGLAKYATRYSGGGYIHSTPIEYAEIINKQFVANDKTKTLGTFTGTRKCIRTTEEHARFMFNWILNGKKNPHVNEQPIKDNVLVITI